jgi:hypothetical protein
MEKLVVGQLVKMFPFFHGNWFTTASIGSHLEPRGSTEAFRFLTAIKIHVVAV